MDPSSQHDRLKHRLRHHRPGRQVIPAQAARWGELIIPAADENPDKGRDGLRIVAVTSFWFGYLALETIKAYESRYPGQLNLVAVITDDPVDPGARISLKKRIWHFVPPKYYLDIESRTIEAALAFGIPVYTGEIKCDWFRRQLREWQPDVVICCGFGQLMDKAFLSLPSMGTINIHPSDLAASHGAGPAPHKDVFQRNAEFSRWTAHQMNEEIDAGRIIGSSPRIRITHNRSGVDYHPLHYYHKLMRDGLDYMVVALLDSLCRKYAVGDLSAVNSVDFEQAVPHPIKCRMLEPCEDFRLELPMPEPDKDLFSKQ